MNIVKARMIKADKFDSMIQDMVEDYFDALSSEVYKHTEGEAEFTELFPEYIEENVSDDAGLADVVDTLVGIKNEDGSVSAEDMDEVKERLTEAIKDRAEELISAETEEAY